MSKPLSSSDWAVLAALSEQAAHGFYLVSLFAKEGSLGAIWTIQRPQVYRALDYLEARAFIRPLRQESGEAGPPRTVYALTEIGQQALDNWYETPVIHFREGRSDLLLKLVFLQRCERSARALLSAQEQVFKELYSSLMSRLEQAESSERLVSLWRLEMMRAALQFIASQLDSLSQ